MHEPFETPLQQHRRTQLEIKMLEIIIREPMVDVEQALDAARGSVIDGGMVEPAASRVFQRHAHSRRSRPDYPGK
ncbi:hypothetical protein ACIPUD_37850 [Bradyrhizobium sp. CAR08]